MYESSTGRRFGPAFISVLVVLAATAGTVAYVVARQVLAQPAATLNQSPGTSQPGEQPGSGSTSPGTAPGPASGPAGTPTTPGPNGKSCPTITVAAVRARGLPGELKLLVYVDGGPPGPGAVGAEVWVCEDADGTLVYQGHQKSGAFLAATSDHTILLARGIRGKVERERGGFVATNPKDPSNLNDPIRTEYHVARTGITLVDRPSNRITFYPAVALFPAL